MTADIWQEGFYNRAPRNQRAPGQIELTCWQQASYLLGLEAVLLDFIHPVKQHCLGVLAPTAKLTTDWNGPDHSTDDGLRNRRYWDWKVMQHTGWGYQQRLRRGTTCVVLQCNTYFGRALTWIPGKTAQGKQFFGQRFIMLGYFGWLPINFLSLDQPITLGWEQQQGTRVGVMHLSSRALIFQIKGGLLELVGEL